MSMRLIYWNKVRDIRYLPFKILIKYFKIKTRKIQDQ